MTTVSINNSMLILIHSRSGWLFSNKLFSKFDNDYRIQI